MDQALQTEQGRVIKPNTVMIRVKAEDIQTIAAGSIGRDLSADELEELSERVWQTYALTDMILEQVEQMMAE